MTTSTRRVLDRRTSWEGVLLTLVLLVGGFVALWTSNYIGDQVSGQLSMQDITMPSGAALKALPAKDAAALQPFAGQKMTRGDQAEAFADHYIIVHMNKASGGQTYNAVSGKFLAMAKDPNADQKQLASLGELRQTLFMGNTLRGLLLNAYAVGTIGVVAFWAGVGMLVAAALMLVLVALGFRHARTGVIRR